MLQGNSSSRFNGSNVGKKHETIATIEVSKQENHNDLTRALPPNSAISQEQDKSSDIEQQPPFGDCKYSNTLPQKKAKPTETSHNLDKV